MSKIKYLIAFFLTPLLIIIIIHFINRFNFIPSKNQEIALISFYNNKLEFKNKEDIINFQNLTIDLIRQESNGIDEINIEKILFTKKGLCFDRSLLMQKVFFFKGIKVRPVYIYSNPNGKTKVFDFFLKRINSHSVFEIFFGNEWYVIETNQKMTELITLEKYITNCKIFKSPRYVRYISNRHGRFISPAFVPDIYFNF